MDHDVPAAQSARALRFGLSVHPHLSRQEWTVFAQQVEAAGFDVLPQSDHLVPAMSPFSSLAHAAAATERLRIGTLVLNNDFRHPVITTREAATLDVLSGGRMELGLGAGHMRSEYAQVGIPFEAPAVRVARLEEATSIVRGLLRGDDVILAGTHYDITGHALGFDTVQQPVPLLIGGNGDRVLALAAQRADIVGFVGFHHRELDSQVVPSHFTEAGLVDRIDHVRQAAGEDRFAGLELNVLVQHVELTEDAGRAAEAMATRLGGVATEDLLASPFFLIGTVHEIADKLNDLRSRLGVTYFACFEPSMAAMALVIDHCRNAD